MKSVLIRDGETVSIWDTTVQNDLMDVMQDIELEEGHHVWTLKTKDDYGSILAIQTADQDHIIKKRGVSV